MFALGQKLILERFQLHLIGVILMYFSLFNQNRASFSNLNHYLRRKMPMKNFPTISDIISLQFSEFP